MWIERLESRMMLAGSCSITLVDGVLSIDGTSRADEIAIEGKGESIDVKAGEAATGYSVEHVKNIVIRSKGGDDRVNVELNGGPQPISVFAGPGNDVVTIGSRTNSSTTLFGGPGNDRLVGGSGRDVIFGGLGSDRIWGEAGNDSLFGGPGVDYLWGGYGDDANFGGIDGRRDVMTGGKGIDRFLASSEDKLIDKGYADVRLLFTNQDARWSDSQVLKVDEALSVLQERTGNVTLLKTANGNELTFIRKTRGINPPGYAWNNGRRAIYIYDAAFTRSSLEQVVWHEIAHNWDEAREMGNAAHERFLATSGWTKWRRGLDKKTYAQATNAKAWWYLKDAPFVLDACKRGPNEDWALTMEKYVTLYHSHGLPVEGEAPHYQDKLDAVDALMQQLSAFHTAGARERSLWTSVMHSYLADPLWLERDAYDAGHNLLVPVHAAWATGETSWLEDLKSHLRRFLDGGVNGLSEEVLYRVHYLYAWTQYAALTAERGAADTVVRDFVAFADAEVRRLWLETPAWMWDHPDFASMRERVLWKLDAVDPEYSYYRAITDHELFVFAMAGDLQSYATATGFSLSPAVQDVLDVAYRVFATEVSWQRDGGWLFQPGVWEDHPHFAFAGHTEKGADLAPMPVPGVAQDSSHSIRFPAWLRSLEGAYPPGSYRREFYSQLLMGLERQFFAHVAVAPSEEFHGWRTTNYMDGWNGLYRWHHDTQGNDGFGPYQLSGTPFIGWWSLLGTRRSTEMYRDIADQFPLSPEQVAYYVGPNTTRVRHPLATEPDAFENGLHELLVLLATKVEGAL